MSQDTKLFSFFTKLWIFTDSFRESIWFGLSVFVISTILVSIGSKELELSMLTMLNSFIAVACLSFYKFYKECRKLNRRLDQVEKECSLFTKHKWRINVIKKMASPDEMIRIGAVSDDSDLIEYGLFNGGDIEYGCFGLTPIMWAAYLGNYNAAKTLKFFGADLNAKAMSTNLCDRGLRNNKIDGSSKLNLCNYTACGLAIINEYSRVADLLKPVRSKSIRAESKEVIQKEKALENN